MPATLAPQTVARYFSQVRNKQLEQVRLGVPVTRSPPLQKDCDLPMSRLPYRTCPDSMSLRGKRIISDLRLTASS